MLASLTLPILLATASAAPAQPIRITGRVFEAREPFAGARVELHPAAPVYEDALRELAGDPPLPLKTTRTGTDGTFELLAPESGAWRVVVQAKDRLALEHLVVPAVDEVSLPPAELMRPATIAIQALGPDGRTLAGLPLRVARPLDNLPWRHMGWQPAERRGITDPDGRLTLPRWKHEPLDVYVTDPLYLGRAASKVLSDSMTVRPESRPRTIEVIGAQGKPVAGALLRWGTWPVGVTGADGRLSVSLPGDKDPPLLVEGPGGERAELSAEVEPVAGVLIVRLAPPEAVTGRVADAQTGKPIAGALVWSGLPPDLPPVRTAEDGTFRLPMPAAGRPFGVSARGYETSAAQGGSAKPVAVALKRTAAVRGQVVDTAGAPIAGASIQVIPGPSQDRNLSSPAYMAPPFSGADGGFSIPGLLPGGVYKLTAHRAGYGRSQVEIKVAPAGRPTPARIVLGSGSTVTGRIVDEGGNPVEGAEVTMMDPEMPDPGSLARTTSDATGAFAIPHGIPGSFQIFARRAGYAPASRSGVVVPEGDGRVDAGEITLKSGSAIEGQVTDTRGRAVEGAEVQAHSEMGLPDLGWVSLDEPPPPDARSGPDGRFRIDDLERGRRYSLSVRHPDHPHEHIPGVETPTAEPVVIELQPARTLTVRVVGPDGEPVPDAEVNTVHATGPGGFSSGPLGRTDSAGELRKSDLKPGLLDLRVTARGYRDTWWKGIQLPQDRDPDPVTVTMERGSVLEVRARDGEGNPLAGVRVLVHPKVPAEGMVFRGPFDRLTTDGDGLVRIDDLAPGEHTVSGSIPGAGRSAEATVRLGSETARVDLLFEQGLAIAGRVVNEEGEPIPSALVQAQSAVEGQGVHVRGGYSEADGSFRIPDLREGEHHLTASAKGYATSEPRSLRLGGSEVEGIEIRLSPEALGAISGRVLGLPAEALSRLQLEADGPVDWDTTTSTVDEQGRYRLSGLRSGRWKVRAYQHLGGLTVQEEAVVEPGAEVVLDLQFPEGLTFSGRVSLDGRPLRGAQIVATAVGDQASHAIGRADFEGRFSLGPLKPGPHLFLVRGAPFGIYRTVVLQEGQEVRLEIETGGLQGRVLAENGEPVPDAVVQLRVVDPATTNEIPGPTLRSDAQGAFEMLSIPAGTYNLVVQKPGFEEARFNVEIGPGAPGVQDVVIKPRGM